MQTDGKNGKTAKPGGDERGGKGSGGAGMAGELGFSKLTLRAMLGHASQSVTPGYIQIDDAARRLPFLSAMAMMDTKDGEGSRRAIGRDQSHGQRLRA
ncbi:MAG: hypothetical protein RLZZ501_2326 [Pseudomonadota bacterium]